jgi:hypothetical protein
MAQRNGLARPPAIRISVSNWQTSAEDVERTLAAFEAAVYAGQAPAR